MDTLAPPVVAVVVAHDPGPWFEETLASLASQDYAELSVLILDAGSEEDLTARVAAVLPTAFVRRFDENRGFGATVNEALTMVDGADYFLVCHDDVALFPDAVHLMVEEAFRSNAGIVTPKVVSWDDPERLIHVGMTADKGGSVVDRVQPHEIDHGQHDAVRRRLRRPRRRHADPGRPVRGARGIRPRHRGHGRGPRPVLAGPGGRGPHHRGPRRPGPPSGGAGRRLPAHRPVPG